MNAGDGKKKPPTLTATEKAGAIKAAGARTAPEKTAAIKAAQAKKDKKDKE